MARAISSNITAVHLTDDLEAAETFKQQWERVAPDVPLLIIDSPYRAFAAPMIAYMELLERTEPDKRITVILPGFNNWLLFAATVEAFLKRAGDPTWDRMRVDYALRQHEQWYKGDGVYGDGPQFHFDYYNAYVIQPMLVDVLDACADDRPAWQAMREPVLTRARRYAAIQERLIAPDGAFPPVGRSLAYRCGAFQGLAQAALRRDLPKDVTPGQARAALGAVIARTLDAPGTFDANGWLTLGLCGHQPGIAETYISTGSLYLCSAAFLPLGLPASDPFWTDAPRDWTAKRAWRGEPIPIDKAL